jgi:hypothetical protein
LFLNLTILNWNHNRIAGIRNFETLSRIKSWRQQRKREPGESGNGR